MNISLITSDSDFQLQNAYSLSNNIGFWLANALKLSFQFSIPHTQLRPQAQTAVF